jgi:hypothetical protein
MRNLRSPSTKLARACRAAPPCARWASRGPSRWRGSGVQGVVRGHPRTGACSPPQPLSASTRLVGRQPGERRMRALCAVKFHPRSDLIARLRPVLECEQIDALRARSWSSQVFPVRGRRDFRDPDLEYTFKHALTHEVAYQGLLQDRQRSLHASIRVVARVNSGWTCIILRTAAARLRLQRSAR